MTEIDYSELCKAIKAEMEWEYNEMRMEDMYEPFAKEQHARRVELLGTPDSP